MARPVLIGTSWKMNKTVREAAEYAQRLPQLLSGAPGLAGIQLFVIPPYTAIDAMKRSSAGHFWVGAQNMHWDDWGAFTGEISAPMLAELGVDLVELGHAERRRYFNETDETVGLKVSAALKHGIRPLVCVGEQRSDRDNGVGEVTVTRQLRSAFRGVPPECADRVIVAYEPVWAIGQITAASAVEVRAMGHVIRETLCDLFASEGDSVPVLYGGTVDEGNCTHILNEGRTDGLFVGRAAASVEGFARIVTACASSLLCK